MCAVCCMLEDKKCETVSLWTLLSLLKQQMRDTRTVLSTDRMNLESCLTSDQSLQLAGHSSVFLTHII